MIDLFSGAVGGVIVFVLTVLWAAVRDGRQRVRARIGYARLLEAELESNQGVLNRLQFPPTLEDLAKGEDPLAGPAFRGAPWWLWSDFLDSPFYTWPTHPSRLTLDAWREVREPLVPLINAEDFKTLDLYYRLIAELQPVWEDAWSNYRTLEDSLPEDWAADYLALENKEGMITISVADQDKYAYLVYGRMNDSYQQRGSALQDELAELTNKATEMLSKYSDLPDRRRWLGF